MLLKYENRCDTVPKFGDIAVYRFEMADVVAVFDPTSEVPLSTYISTPGYFKS